MPKGAPLNTRRDGWTAARQLRFLDMLVRSRSVTRAAAAAGMSRKSAYRLRDRPDGALFAAMWNQALRNTAARSEGHKLAAGKRDRTCENRGNPPKDTKWRKWRTPRFRDDLAQLRGLWPDAAEAVSPMTLDGPAGRAKFPS